MAYGVNSSSICTSFAIVDLSHVCMRITHLLGVGCCVVESICHVAGEQINMSVVAAFRTSHSANLQLYVLNVFGTCLLLVVCQCY